MSEYDKELDSRSKEWEKARGPLQGNESTVQRPDDSERDTVNDRKDREDGDQPRGRDSISK